MYRIIAILLLMLPPAAMADIHLVAPDGSGDFPDIQAAIAGSAEGDTIQLEAGIFTGPGNRDIALLGKALTIERADPQTECIIDCVGSLGDPHTGFYFNAGEDSMSVVRGLTIVNGFLIVGGGIYCGYGTSPTLADLVLINNAAERGGGIYCNHAAPQIVNLTLYANSASVQGGGIYCSGDVAPRIVNTIIAGSLAGEAVFCEGTEAVPTLTCCDLFGNAGGDWEGCIADQAGLGGNISVDPVFCDPEGGDLALHVISHCAPYHNPACGRIGARPVACGYETHVVAPDGSGDYPTIQAAIDGAYPGDTIALTNGTFTGAGNRDLELGGKALTIRSQEGPLNCVIDCGGSALDPHCGFYLNDADGSDARLEGLRITGGHFPAGGAIYCGPNSAPTMINIIMHGNVAEYGGALYSNAAYPALLNVTIYGNSGTIYGGGLYCTGSRAPFVRNTIIAGSVTGAAVFCEGSENTPRLTCCDLWSNAGGDWTGHIADQLGLDGNFTADPLFCDPETATFELHTASPCAPVNNPTCGAVGALGIGCAPTGYIITPDGLSDIPTIQAGIQIALPGDSILLAPGVFTGEGNRDIDLMGKELTIISQHAHPESVIIDCAASPAEPHTGFIAAAGETGATCIKAITITGGYAAAGGGIYCGGGAKPLLSNIIFRQNCAELGGGLYCNASSPEIISATFFDNEGTVHGGGIYCTAGSAPHVRNTIIAFCPAGEALYCEDPGAAPLMECCDFSGNAGGDWVGEIAAQLGLSGNISADPRFCFPAGDGLTLDAESPCLPFTPPNEECALLGALGEGCVLAGTEPEAATHAAFALTCSPNPAVNGTWITFRAPAPATRLEIVDLGGRIVWAETDPPGRIFWDGSPRVGAGLYYCRLRAGSAVLNRRLLVLR